MTTEFPAYSCVIPSRDRCALVQEAVASVLVQEVPPAEIIVVDDGSRDGTAAVLAARFGRRVKLLPLAGQGPGPARNAGVAAAGGQVIMFLDSDDLWQPDHAHRLLARLADGYQVAYGPTRNLDQVNGGEFLLPGADEAVEDDCFAALLRWCFLVPSALAVTRRAFLEVGGFAAIPLAEDWLFLLKLAAGHRFACAAGPPLTLRRLHPGSLCHLATASRLVAALRQAENYFAAPAGLPALTPEQCRQARQRFAALAAWTASRAEQQGWNTVQEWYLALQRAGLV